MRSRQLLSVDIARELVYAYEPATGHCSSLSVEGPVSAVALRDEGHLLAAVGNVIASINRETGSLKALTRLPLDEHVKRLNDGKVDSAGRFWCGSMSPAKPGAAALYCIEPEGSTTVALSGVSLSNGMGWSPDDRLFYYIDSWALDR